MTNQRVDPTSSESLKTKVKNFLKIRDDHKPITFTKVDEETFEIDASLEVAWLPEERFGYKELRNRIEPWLTSLFQSEHLSLLVGSGLTHAIHRLATGENAAGMSVLTFSRYSNEINQAAAKSAEAAGRKNGNLEDQIRIANELLRGLEILQKNDEADTLRKQIQTGMLDFAKSILKSEEELPVQLTALARKLSTP